MPSLDAISMSVQDFDTEGSETRAPMLIGGSTGNPTKFSMKRIGACNLARNAHVYMYRRSQRIRAMAL
jgi:hypothetical protein